MKEKQIAIEIEEICSFLKESELFKNLSQSALRELVSSMTLVYINGSERLINQGDTDYSLFILYSGRLAVYRDNEWIADLTRGQIIGEISLLVNEPRTSTVQALRDSCLIKITLDNFRKFEEHHLKEILTIAKTAIKRLIPKPHIVRPGENMKTIAIVPAGDTNHQLFAGVFGEELTKFKQTCLINSTICNQYFNCNVSNIKSGDSNDFQISFWLQSLESKYEYLLLVTDLQMSPWTERCLRQADRLLLVADSQYSSVKNSIEDVLFHEDFKNDALVELILLHPDQCSKISGTHNWLASRPIKLIHHLRLGVYQDWSRLMRRFMGKALGLALSGGGARGFIQIGVIQAIEELGFSIDLICGSSMGAIIGGAYAAVGIEKMLEFSKIYGNSHYLDYTVPIVAFLKGKKLCDYFIWMFGEIKIEDLWKQYLCVSTNLTKRSLEIHDHGLIWKPLRATATIPGIYPPFYTETGDMLVDGGILNNLPVDILKNYMTGGKILAVSCLADNKKNIELSANKFSKTGWTSGWHELMNTIKTFGEKSNDTHENIFSIIMDSIMLSSENHQRKWEQEADFLLKLNTGNFGLMDFNEAEKMIEFGYKQGMEKLPLILRDLESL